MSPAILFVSVTVPVLADVPYVVDTGAMLAVNASGVMLAFTSALVLFSA